MSQHFEEKAKEWDTEEKKNRARDIGEAIRQSIRLDQQMDVMDFGAGTGLLSEQIAPYVRQIIAVDTSKAMLDEMEAKEIFKGKLKRIEQDIVESPVELSADVIISSLTLHHIHDLNGVFQQFYSILKDNGKIALADLDKEDGTFHDPGVEGVHHHGFNRDEFRQVMERNGFTDIQITTVHHIVHDDGKSFPLFLAVATKG